MQSALSISLIVALILIMIILLLLEYMTHNKRLKTIQIRITVTGTRGKTSITRILASILRESGKKVLAKTTGTEAIYILPDGTEENVRRRGAVNILEQKHLIRKASKLGVDYLVSEIMSIHPENHRVESQLLFKPHFTIISNLRPDHLDASSEGDMWKVYLNDIYFGSTVLIPENELNTIIRRTLFEKQADILTVPEGPWHTQNQAMAIKMAKKLGCTEGEINNGILSCKMDRGEAFAYKFNKGANNAVFVNSFAANDPVSSAAIINSLSSSKEWVNYKIVALVSLRHDRGERSQQWLTYLKKDEIPFDKVFCIGRHARSFQRELPNVKVLESNKPEEISKEILENIDNDSIIFGLANIVGVGLNLSEYWKLKGNKINVIAK